jgi:outer membrane receptor for ferrienterochelin and colicins
VTIGPVKSPVTLRRTLPALCAAVAVHAAAQSQPQPQPAPAPPAAGSQQQIEITGGREGDTEQRRRSTAAKIIVGRDEIDRYGDSTLGEVLRRLPGVTTPGAPGRGGPPRMRGLGGGYTQILIDGQRVPPGFSFESITPDQIERIEILRAPTAETGAQAIAGTINIITREGYRRRVNDLRASVALENGETTPGVSWTRNDSAGALTYNLSGSAFDNHRRSLNTTRTTEVDLASGAVTADRTESGETRESRQGVHATARLQWRLGEGQSLTLAPNLFANRSHSERRFEQAGGSDYDFGTTTSDGRFTTLRVNGQWRQRLTGALRLELLGHAGGFRSENATDRLEFRRGGAAPQRRLQERTTSDDRSANLTAKLTQVFGAGGTPESEHNAVYGVEAEAVQRDELRTTLLNGANLLPGFADTLEASSLRLAAYAQDEWSLSPHWAVHAGARWEGVTTRGDAGNGERPVNRSGVLTPLLHAVWKPDPKGRDQVRMSLTRSYRAPQVGSLIARPNINNRVPTGENSPTTPDRAGNPDLRPETAIGIDVAVERYLAGGGLLSANLFRRNLSDLMRNVTALETTVSWSAGPRYVSRPQNIGKAVTQGIELETKFGLDQLVDGAPRVELRGNLAFYRSKVDSVPGPDNRLAEQAKATGNLGADYRWRALPLMVGGNLNWVPAYETQLAEDQRTGVSAKRIFDVFALWTFNPALALRVMAGNLAPRDYTSVNTLAGAGTAETARSTGPSYTQWQFRLEAKL